MYGRTGPFRKQLSERRTSQFVPCTDADAFARGCSKSNSILGAATSMSMGCLESSGSSSNPNRNGIIFINMISMYKQIQLFKTPYGAERSVVRQSRATERTTRRGQGRMKPLLSRGRRPPRNAAELWTPPTFQLRAPCDRKN